MDIVKSSCIRRVCVVVLKRRKRRRVALNVTLKARAFFCVDVKENGLRKSKRRRRDFLRKKNRARVSFIRDGIYIEYRVSILSRLKRLLRFQSEKRDFVRHRFFVDQVPGFI